MHILVSVVSMVFVPVCHLFYSLFILYFNSWSSFQTSLQSTLRCILKVWVEGFWLLASEGPPLMYSMQMSCNSIYSIHPIQNVKGPSLSQCNVSMSDFIPSELNISAVISSGSLCTCA